MNNMLLSTLLILFLSSLSCANLGTFVVLKNQAMITDALSHTVLLGIVIAFLAVPDIDSPLLHVGAALVGVLTVYLIEWTIQKTKIKNDAATGLIFTMLFALAVICVSKYLRNVHMDIDCVLMGDVTFSPFNTYELGEFIVPKSVVSTVILLITSNVFLFIFWNELEISIFDGEFAQNVGIRVPILNFLFMFLVSLTTVVNFSVSGSILVISFFVAPAMTAHLFTKTMRSMYFWTLCFSTLNCTLGFFLAVYLNVSMAGMCSTISFITFLVVFGWERWKSSNTLQIDFS